MNLVPLSQVCQLVNGGTPKSGVAEYWGGDVAWLTPAEMGKLDTPEIESTSRTITKAGLKNSSAKQVPVRAVIMSTRAPIGHLAIPLAPMAFNQGCRGLVPSKALDTKYLYYFLRYSRQRLDELGTGTTFKELSSSALGAYKIPLPSIEEQQRTVAVLDETFATIAVATANAEKNLANARELPSAALGQFDLSGADSELRRLGDLVTRLTNGYVGPTRNIYVDIGVPYLLARHVKDDVLKFDERTYITASFNAAHKKSMLEAGDVLLVQSGHIGHSAVVPTTHAGHNCHAMIVITPRPQLLGEYLSGYFNSVQGREATARIRSGSTVPHLTCKEVRELRIPVPPLDTQRALVERYKALRQHSAKLIAFQEQKLRELTALKQSLLHRAFSGELTGREPIAA